MLRPYGRGLSYFGRHANVNIVNCNSRHSRGLPTLRRQLEQLLRPPPGCLSRRCGAQNARLGCPTLLIEWLASHAKGLHTSLPKEIHLWQMSLVTL
jgi:hypothetical protein